MVSQFLHLLLYSTIVAVYFGALVRRELREQVKLAAWIWLAMVGGTLVLAWVMYPFPA